MNTEDRSHIDHQERVWDYNRSFEQLIREQERGPEKVERLKDLENEQEIRELLKKLLSAAEYQEISQELSIPKLIDYVNRSDIKDRDKQEIISLIEFSAA